MSLAFPGRVTGQDACCTLRCEVVGVEPLRSAKEHTMAGEHSGNIWSGLVRLLMC